MGRAEAKADIRQILNVIRAAETLAPEANATDDGIEIGPAALDRYTVTLGNPRLHIAEDAWGWAQAVQVLCELVDPMIVTTKGSEDDEVYLASFLETALHRDLVVPQKGGDTLSH